MNDFGKISRTGHKGAAKRSGRASGQEEAAQTSPEGGALLLGEVGKDMSWVDRLEALDDDAAAAALERPGPDSYERADLRLD